MINFVKHFLKATGIEPKPELMFVDVERLYSDTLMLSSEIRPWAVIDGKYAALELRLEFAEDYLKSQGDFDFINTNYYKFIDKYTKDGFKNGYDGNWNYAIINPDDICRRYTALIRSVLKNIELYNNLNKDNVITSIKSIYDDIIDFEKRNKRDVFYIRENRKAQQKENEQYRSDKTYLRSTVNKRLVGHLIPSAVAYKDNIVIKNGSHRLALFKALKDKNIFKNKLPIYVVGKLSNGLYKRSTGRKKT